MRTITDWRDQDVLHFEVSDWVFALQQADIFDENALRMIHFVYEQPKHRSTATDIARHFSTFDGYVHPNLICAYNRKVSRKLYHLYNKQPPVSIDLGNRFWNALFDGVPDEPCDKAHHFYWQLRPKLIQAMRQVGLVSM